MAADQNLKDHQSWIGYLQPEGLVVSPAALVDSQASLDLGQAVSRQLEFKQFVEWIPNPIVADQEREPQVYAISSFPRLLQEFLNWPSERIQGLSSSNPIPEELKIPLRDFGETLEPTHAFLRQIANDDERSGTDANQDGVKPWLMLLQELPSGTRLDVPVESKLSGWSASPTRRFERLLRETEIPIGLLTNSTHIQLIYAPRGENSGTMTFPVAAMTEISGRPILAAFHMLLSRYRLLAAPTKDRLPGLLQRSRDYQVRVAGDAVVAAFFAADKPKTRKEIQARHFESLEQWIQKSDFNARKELHDAIHSLSEPTANSLAVIPFHWEIEFPEVFSRELGGFDAFIGNPPFAGKNTLINGNRAGYLEWLMTLHKGAHGNSDIVAHFFRRCFTLLAKGGTFGLVATNTIGQGDTRQTGLTWIRNNGGTIYCASRRRTWPGIAAVIISIVHVLKQQASNRSSTLDGQVVSIITAYLFHAGRDDEPTQLKTQPAECFQGATIHGPGFIFDDAFVSKGSYPYDFADELIKTDPVNAQAIKPLIGWQEITNSPSFAPRRRVIDFSSYSLEDASANFPVLFQLARERVYPWRQTDKRASYRKYWWQFAERREALNTAKSKVVEVLTCSAKATTHLSFANLPASYVFTNSVNVIICPHRNIFSVLQSRVHEVWARFFGSSLKDDLTYTSGACFETFPFPSLDRIDGQIGTEYLEVRRHAMDVKNAGLTDVYNSFHDPFDLTPEICQLRTLHQRMDNAVLLAYGWQDLATLADCAFLLSHEEDDEAESASDSRRKKPLRLRWRDEFRDKVLARLLELNEQRADEERRSGAAAEKKASKNGSSKKSTKKKSASKSTPLLDKDLG